MNRAGSARSSIPSGFSPPRIQLGAIQKTGPAIAPATISARVRRAPPQNSCTRPVARSNPSAKRTA